MGCAGLKLARAWGAEAIALTRNRQKAERLSTLADHTAIVGTAEELSPALRALRPAGVDAVIDPLGGPFVGAAVEALATGGHYVGYEWVAGSTGTYDVRTLMANDASIHGFTIFRLVRHPGVLTRIIRIGAGLADKLKPVL